MNHTLAILKSLLLVIIFLMTGMLVFFGLIKPERHEVAMIDFSVLPAGEWQWEEPIYTFFDNVNLQILEDGSSNKYLNAVSHQPEDYTGFGFENQVDVPPTAALVLEWRARDAAPDIQIDVVDGSPKPSGPVDGEVFSRYESTPGEEWSMLKIPLNEFERNQYQDHANNADGYLHSNGISKVQFTIKPESNLDLDIRSVIFQWQSFRESILIIISVIVLLAGLLWMRTNKGDLAGFSETRFFNNHFSARLIFCLLVVAFILYMPGIVSGEFNFMGVACFIALFMFAILDDFYTPSEKFMRWWNLRYQMLLGVFCLAAFAIQPAVIFLIALAALLPCIQTRDSLLLLGAPLFALLGLLPHFSQGLNAELILPFSVVMLATVLSLVLLEVLNKYFPSVQSPLNFQFEQLYALNPDAIFLMDQEGKIHQFNDAFCQLLGRKRESIIDMHFQDFLRASNNNFISNIKDNISCDLEINHASGQSRVARLEMQPIYENGELAGYQGVAVDMTYRRQTEKHVLEISEREQQRIGHELHDTVVQDLTATALAGDILINELQEDLPEATSRIREFIDLVDRSSKQVRRLAKGLSPVNLDEIGLSAALDEMAQTVEKLNGIPCTVEGDDAIKIDDQKILLNVYRIIQEAVNNAVKHAEPDHIIIYVQQQENTLLITVEDDGYGFDTETALKHGMGLHIIRYRVELINGYVEIKSQHGKGTCVYCSIPVTKR